jgi:hypothetical protein
MIKEVVNFPKPRKMDHLITTQQASKVLNCTVRNISYLVKKGILTPKLKNTNLFLYEPDDVENLKPLMNVKATK